MFSFVLFLSTYDVTQIVEHESKLKLKIEIETETES